MTLNEVLGKPYSIDPRGTVFMPAHLSAEERSLILKHIKRIQNENPEYKKDYILVDELKGEFEIKFLKYDLIEKICLESGYRLTPNDVVMYLMKKQNNWL